MARLIIIALFIFIMPLFTSAAYTDSVYIVEPVAISGTVSVNVENPANVVSATILNFPSLFDVNVLNPTTIVSATILNQITDYATEGTQNQNLVELQAINTELDTQTSVLNSIDSALTSPLIVSGTLNANVVFPLSQDVFVTNPVSQVTILNPSFAVTQSTSPWITSGTTSILNFPTFTGLTNAELRATPVAVSGSITVNNPVTSVSVNNTVSVSTTGINSVSGNITLNNQISGFATEETVSATNAKIPTGLTVSGTRLLVELSASGGSGLTNTELRASPVVVSGTIVQLDVSGGFTGLVNAADVSSTTFVGQLGQKIITGSPTAGSTSSYTISNAESVRMYISGTFVGTLQAEISFDSGSTYVATTILVDGAGATSSINSRLVGSINTTGANRFRVRMTSFTSGAAQVQITSSPRSSLLTTNALQAGDWNIANQITGFATESTTLGLSNKFPTASVLNDALVSPATTSVASYLMAFNGSSWDRVRTDGTDNDADPIAATGILSVESHNQLYNGTSWDRMRGSISNGLLVDVSRVSGTVNVSATPIIKGIQGANGFTVQDIKDSGRVFKAYSGTFTASTTESFVTLTPSSDGVAGTNGTAFSVSSGKRFRVQSLCVSTRNAGAAVQGVIVLLRVSSGGVPTTSTVQVTQAAAGTSIAIANNADLGCSIIPDGLEISGTEQFGISQIGTNTGNNIVTLTGYEY